MDLIFIIKTIKNTFQIVSMLFFEIDFRGMEFGSEVEKEFFFLITHCLGCNIRLELKMCVLVAVYLSNKKKVSKKANCILFLCFSSLMQVVWIINNAVEVKTVELKSTLLHVFIR